MKCFEDEMIGLIYWKPPGNLLTVSIFAKIYGQKYPESFATFCWLIDIDIACYIFSYRFIMEINKRITINSKCEDLWRLQKETVCISIFNTFMYWSKFHINILYKLRYMHLASDIFWQMLNMLMAFSPNKIN